MTRRRRTVLAAVAAAVVAADAASKVAATAVLDGRQIEMAGVVTLRRSYNPGVAFGLGDTLPAWSILAVTIVITAGIAAAGWLGHLQPAAAAGLLAGGAAANVADRIEGGGVVDMIDLGWWPSFNVADAALCVGVAVLALASFRSRPELARG